jgi:hypothetical protein
MWSFNGRRGGGSGLSLFGCKSTYHGLAQSQRLFHGQYTGRRLFYKICTVGRNVWKLFGGPCKGVSIVGLGNPVHTWMGGGGVKKEHMEKVRIIRRTTACCKTLKNISKPTICNAGIQSVACPRYLIPTRAKLNDRYEL